MPKSLHSDEVHIMFAKLAAAFTVTVLSLVFHTSASAQSMTSVKSQHAAKGPLQSSAASGAGFAKGKTKRAVKNQPNPIGGLDSNGQSSATGLNSAGTVGGNASQ